VWGRWLQLNRKLSWKSKIVEKALQGQCGLTGGLTPTDAQHAILRMRAVQRSLPGPEPHISLLTTITLPAGRRRSPADVD
jgi:hypothetical protein